MNNAPRETLRAIVARHGPSVTEDPRRCEALLRDYCGEYRREISVLVMALEEFVVADMLRAPATTPREILLARMSQRLCNQLALSEQAARWSVASWALALGLLSDDELKVIEQAEVAPTKAAITSTEAATSTKVAAAPASLPHRQTVAQQPVTAASVTSIVVSAKNDGDYASLSEALKNSRAGARLLVRPGVYNESVIIDKQVEIIGDGPPEDVIVRSIDASCIQMRTEHATLRGLTLRGRAAKGRSGASFFTVDVPRGKLVLEDCDVTSDTLSCVAVHGSTSEALISRCRIHDGADSGLYLFQGATATVEECEVFCNTNVGVAVTASARVAVRRSRIYDGRDAGVVVWKEGRALLESCEIYGNARAGIGVSEGGNLSARACNIYEGENSGVFVHHDGECRLEGSDIFGHREAEVAVETRGNLVARLCKIHQGQSSGVFVGTEGQALLQECLVANNAGSGVSVGAGALCAVRKCRIKENGQVAVKVAGGGAVNVEESDVADNLLGPWDVEDGAFVETAGNRER